MENFSLQYSLRYLLFQCLAPSSQCGIGRILLGKSRSCQNCSSSDAGSCCSSGKNNPAAWSPTSILCGPCTCQDQRPITSMLMSLVSDVEAVQHSSSLATASSISNSTLQYSSSTSQESFEHSCSSSTEQIANSTALSLKTFLKKCRLVKSHEWLNSKSQRCITNAPAGFDSHQLDLQLSMSPELPWQCPPMDPRVQSLDLNEDTFAASEKPNMQQLKLHDHHEFPVTISLSPANYHTHDAEYCCKAWVPSSACVCTITLSSD